MTAIDELWQALENYQPEADKAGHGKSWVDMCKKKTYVSAEKAYFGAFCENDFFAKKAILEIQSLAK